MNTAAIDLLGLIQQDTQLKREAGTNGGEWAGPCPFCGGTDRFRVWPTPIDGKPRYWCRQCGQSGDAIEYVKQRDGVGFVEACGRLGLSLPNNGGPRRVQSPAPRRPAQRGTVSKENDWPALSDQGWQTAADNFCLRAWEALQDNRPARQYLHDRGLHDSTIAAFELGYNPQIEQSKWGSVRVYLPSGIVLPWLVERRYWAINVRRLTSEEPKYIKAKGSANGLFLCQLIPTGNTVVMVEGEFDAMAVWQETRGLKVTPVATGSVSGSRLHRWIARLSVARLVVLAFDADEAGDKAAAYWKTIFPDAVRLRPLRHDAAAMLQVGDDVRSWVREGAGL